MSVWLVAAPGNTTVGWQRLVVPPGGVPLDFEALRHRNLSQRSRMIAEPATKGPAVLVVFDRSAPTCAGGPLVETSHSPRHGIY